VAKKKVKIFWPGDKVIMFATRGFDPKEPAIAWVAQEGLYPCVIGSRVRVTRHEKEAAEGRGLLVSADYVYPFSDEFWESCLRWLDKKAELGMVLKQLQKGKI
jgi:hypothetical protein